MQVAVGIGRAVVKDEGLPAACVLAQCREEVDPFPAVQDLRFAFRQPGAHGKGGLRQKQRLPVVGSH